MVFEHAIRAWVTLERSVSRTGVILFDHHLSRTDCARQFDVCVTDSLSRPCVSLADVEDKQTGPSTECLLSACSVSSSGKCSFCPLYVFFMVIQWWNSVNRDTEQLRTLVLRKQLLRFWAGLVFILIHILSWISSVSLDKLMFCFLKDTATVSFQILSYLLSIIILSLLPLQYSVYTGNGVVKWHTHISYSHWRTVGPTRNKKLGTTVCACVLRVFIATQLKAGSDLVATDPLPGSLQLVSYTLMPLQMLVLWFVWILVRPAPAAFFSLICGGDHHFLPVLLPTRSSFSYLCNSNVNSSTLSQYFLYMKGAWKWISFRYSLSFFFAFSPFRQFYFSSYGVFIPHKAASGSVSRVLP